MFQTQAKIFGRLHMLLDFCLVSLAFVVSVELQHWVPMTDFIYQFAGIEIPLQVYPTDMYTFYILVGAIYWVFALRSFEAYYSIRKTSYPELAWTVFKAVAIAATFFGTIVFIIEAEQFNRGLFLLIFVTSLLFLLLEKFAILFFLHAIREKGYNYRQFLIVGSGVRAIRFAELLEKHSEWGLRLLGFVDEPERVGREVAGKKVIGSFDDLQEILDNNVIDEVVFCLPRKWMDKLEKYVLICEDVGVRAHLPLDFFNISIAHPKLTEFGNTPLLSLVSTPSQPGGLFIKRGMDIVISAVLVAVLSPLFLLVFLAIKLTSSGPVIFKQERTGRNGREFTMYKFRTMVVGAEEMLEGMKALNEGSGPVFHSRSDPRLTRAGKFIRKFSLDELPQFWNVLIGDMSLVGPRPPLFEEVAGYERWQRRRLSFRPGIVCLWQVTKRYQPDFEEWVKMDLEYIDNWSLALDLKILILTIPAVFKGMMHWRRA